MCEKLLKSFNNYSYKIIGWSHPTTVVAKRKFKVYGIHYFADEEKVCDLIATPGTARYSYTSSAL